MADRTEVPLALTDFIIAITFVWSIALLIEIVSLFMSRTDDRSTCHRYDMLIIDEGVDIRRHVAKYRSSLQQNMASLTSCSATSCNPLVHANYHNMTESRLHNLPPEILLSIVDFLSPRSIIVLRCVSRQFRQRLSNSQALDKKISKLKLSDALELLLQQRHEQYSSSIAISNLQSQLSSSTMLSNYLHQRGLNPRYFRLLDYFFPKISVSSGLSGSLRLCAHEIYSSDELWQDAHLYPGQSWCCLHPSHFNGVLGDPVSLLPSVTFDLRSPDNITVDLLISLFPVDRGDQVHNDRVGYIMEYLDEQLCPHTSTRDIARLHCFRGPGLLSHCTKNWISTPSGLHPQPGPCSQPEVGSCLRPRAPCLRVAYCQVLSCRTSFCFRRVPFADGSLTDMIVFEVSRDLVGGPGCELWQAQLVKQ